MSPRNGVRHQRPGTGAIREKVTRALRLVFRLFVHLPPATGNQEQRQPAAEGEAKGLLHKLTSITRTGFRLSRNPRVPGRSKTGSVDSMQRKKRSTEARANS